MSHALLHFPKSHRRPAPVRTLRVSAAPDVDRSEEEQPDHIDEVPVPGRRLEADMLVRGEMALERAQQADEQKDLPFGKSILPIMWDRPILTRIPQLSQTTVSTSGLKCGTPDGLVWCFGL